MMKKEVVQGAETEIRGALVVEADD